MGRNNQNSKWKAHQTADPEIIVDQSQSFKPEPLKEVSVLTDLGSVDEIAEPVKPLKKIKKNDEEQ